MLLSEKSVEATLDQVLAVPTPDNTKSHFPTPHGTLIECVQKELDRQGFGINESRYTLGHNGESLFGLFSLQTDHNDLTYVAGIRNDHAKRFAQGFVCGMSVLVCDNLSFLGDIVVKRKHTRFALDQLPGIVREGIHGLAALRSEQDDRIEAYKHSRLSDLRAHDLLVKSVDCGALTGSQLAAVLKQWREPDYAEFKPRTCWSFFNAFTTVYKSGSLDGCHRKSQNLHALIDDHLGLGV